VPDEAMIVTDPAGGLDADTGGLIVTAGPASDTVEMNSVLPCI
jgi:hypothetical protein